VPVSRTIFVSTGHNEANRQRAVEEADRVEFEAIIEEMRDVTMRLALWSELTPQTRLC
jgi:hypothetical protein